MSNYCEKFDTHRVARTGLLFTGLYGTGKTHIACSMVSRLVELGRRGVYTSLPRFTRELRSTFGRSGSSDLLLERLIYADFLVLDEIDLHGSSDNDYNVLYDVINARYEHGGRPTLAISNRPLDRLIVDLDERLVSRILGGTQPITFDWSGRRNITSGPAASSTGASK